MRIIRLTKLSGPCLSEYLFAPEARDRVGVEVADPPVARRLVQRLRVRLLRPGVEPRDRIAELARRVLERAEQRARDALAARRGQHVHALDLARAVGQPLHAAAAHRNAVAPADQEDTAS